MLGWKKRRRQKLLKQTWLNDHMWHTMLAELPLLSGLSASDNQQLRELTTLFVAEKKFVGRQDLAQSLDQWQRLLIAVQACLPILHLGLDYYDDWVTIIVYPQRFIKSYADSHPNSTQQQLQELSGESWPRGPLVIAWQDVLQSDTGFNLIIHECAHKLDMLNGPTNGFPPLHSDMDSAWWTRVFQAAYKDFCQRLENSPLDPYAAKDPGEFFAVTSEQFFVAPAVLQSIYPAVYRQLCLFYRQDPVQRLPGHALLRAAPISLNAV